MSIITAYPKIHRCPKCGSNLIEERLTSPSCLVCRNCDNEFSTHQDALSFWDKIQNLFL